MKRISVRIFVLLVGVFALVLALLMGFFSVFFNRLYSGSVVGAMQHELARTVADYCSGDDAAALDTYARQTGSPIFVLTEDLRLLRRGAEADLRKITLALPDGGTAVVPVGYLYNIYGSNAPDLLSGMRVDAELLPLGRGNYYEPLSLTPGTQIFRNLSSIRAYGQDNELPLWQVRVTGVDIPKGKSLQTARAEFIYDHLKGMFIRRDDPGAYLEQLCGSDVAAGGIDYRFLYQQGRLSGAVCYFVTAQRIVITGYERSYLTRTFQGAFGVMGLVLMLAAALLSRTISRPLRQLNEVAGHMADMDFTHRAVSRHDDELGVLAGSINRMADSLQQTLDELHTSNAQLQRSSLEAKHNEARMKKLLADLAHEFKTPLGIISNYLEAIELGLSRDPQQYYRVIDREIENLSFMVNETIELAKLQSGSWRVDPANHNLYDILRGVEEKFSDKLAAAQFAFCVEKSRQTVRCDAHRIDQVIANFISNAAKYADENRRIRVYTADGGSRIRVCVENTGSLAEDQLDRIWQRHYGADIVTPARLPSQGIGLDIVKSILDAHGSEYGVESDNGLVTFWFTLETVL